MSLRSFPLVAGDSEEKACPGLMEQDAGLGTTSIMLVATRTNRGPGRRCPPGAQALRRLAVPAPTLGRVPAAGELF